MRLTSPRLLTIALLPLLILPVCLSQTSPIQVGDGATTPTIREEFLAAYQRGEFFSTVALPPLSEVVSFGTGGFRQEFQDAARTGLRSALIRPAVPDLTLGVNNAVRQVRQPIYAVYSQSSVGVSTAGFPKVDTTQFLVPVSGLSATFLSGYYQTFDKGFGIFIWDLPPLPGGSDTRFNVAEPIFTRWNLIGFDQIGPPLISATAATSRFGTNATYQTFSNGAIYNITSGALSGRIYYVRKSVQDLYELNQGTAGFLGFPIGEETILADGRRRQTFEGGTMEYAINGVPVLKNALQAITVAAENPLRLTAGQSISLTAVLQTIAGEFVTDRDVFWTTSNGSVVTVTGTGPQAILKGIAGGIATITATSEGKTSNRISVQVASQCCSIGEGSPTQAVSQTFLDAVQRNRLSVRTPVATPVRRVGSGYVQEALALPAANRIFIAKADSSPVAYVVSGATLAAYESAGSFTGALGYPISDLSFGLTQRFEAGALAGSPVRVLTGPILTRWLALAAEAGALGPPVTATSTAITFTGAQSTNQQFRAGFIHQFDSGPLAGRAFITTGAIAAKHVELGLAQGAVGAPMTDEFLGANGFRQEFEGAFLEYTAGTPVRVIDKVRRPTLTVTPPALLPGARYRVSVGGFPQAARLRLTQGSGASQDAFDINTVNGSFVWESIVPANARPGVVVLRATEVGAAQAFAEGSYTVRSVAELRPLLSKLSGDAQAGAPAVMLLAPIRVALRDSAGNPISGVPLRFEASPGASVVEASAVTNADGIGQARLRLPAQSGVVLATVEAAGQIVTFSARSAEQVLTDFPRILQSVDGSLGSTTLPLSQKGSLVAAMAGVIRFFQQRGVAPADNGLADTAVLNAFLKSFCATAADGSQICDGFLDPGPGEDPLANPFRAIDFAAGSLALSFANPSLSGLREAFVAQGPVILALHLMKNSLSAGAHFVTVTGILGDGDLAIADPNPQFGLTRLSQYTTGFSAAAANWRATPVAALQFSANSIPAAFYTFSSSKFAVVSPGFPCTSVATWPATIANLSTAATATQVYLQACDGNTPSYQLSATAAPFLASLVSLNAPAARSVVSGANATAYRVSRNEVDSWTLTPERLSLQAASIVNAANFGPRMAPGAIISIFGNGLPIEDGPASTVQLDGQTLPIFFSNSFQLNTAIPVSANPGQATLTVRSPFGESSAAIEISDLAPGLFLIDSRGSAAALNQDSTLNTASNPAVRGQAVVLFATGLGAVAVQPSGLSATAAPVSVLLNGRELVPFFAGLAPGFIGLFQVNVAIPVNLPPWLNQSVVLRTGGIDSNLALLSIR
jgi:uncharacterized protein (TIGR03437 family)